MRRLAIATLLLAARAGAHPTGTVEGTVRVLQAGLFGRVSDKSDRSGVVVELDVRQPPPVAPRTRYAMHQRNRQFEPSFLAVVRGSRVDFPNDDKEDHSVFSLSEPHPFELPLYRSGTSHSVVFERPGAIDVLCSIHPDMAATIRVVESPWFTITDANGHFSIRDVPPGSYGVTIWPSRGNPWHGQVVVAPGATATLSGAQVVEGRPRSIYHADKNGRPYAPYP